jgi:hypothetical protein
MAGLVDDRCNAQPEGQSFLAYSNGFGNRLAVLDTSSHCRAAEVVPGKVQPGNFRNHCVNCCQAILVAQVVLRYGMGVGGNA